MTNDTPPSFVPTSDGDVREMVRTVTDYDDRELPRTKVEKHLAVAKTVLYTKVDSDTFYSDAGLGQALVFTTAMLAKNAVENYSVTRWNIGDQYIDAGTETGSADAQMQQWNEYVREGIRQSDAAPTGPRNTTEYIG